MSNAFENPTYVQTLADASEFSGGTGSGDSKVSAVTQLDEVPTEVSTLSDLQGYSPALSSKQNAFKNLNVSPQGAISANMQSYGNGNGLWAGRDGGVYKVFFGDANGKSMRFDGSGLVSSNMTLVTRLTTGFYAEAGWMASVSSVDGKVYPSGITSVSSLNTNLATPALPVGSKMRFLEMTDTIKCVMASSGSGGGTSVFGRLSFSQTDPTTGSSSSASLQSSSELDTDVAKVDTTTAFQVNLGTIGSREPRAGTIRQLDTTITVDGTVNMSTADGTSCTVEIWNSTTALAFYTVASDTTRIKFNNPTFTSGGTTTNGTESNLFTAGGTVKVRSVKRFGTSNYYLLTYTYSDVLYARAMLFDGSSWTLGTETTVASISAGIKGHNDLLSIDDSSIIIVYNDGTNIKSHFITRSGTTISFGAVLTIQSASSSGDAPCLSRISATRIGVGTRYDASNFKVYLLYYYGTTLTSESNLSLSSTATSAGGTLMRFSPTVLLAGFPDTTTSMKWSSITCANNYASFSGFYNTGGSADAMVEIVYSGLYTGLTGLTGSTQYYRDYEERTDSIVNVSQGKSGFSFSSTSISVAPLGT